MVTFSLPLILSTLVLIALGLTGRSLRGTTLVAARWWAVVAAALTVGVEGCLWASPIAADRQMTLRYIAAAATFCPMMAVLGAKRPQNGPWQMIVFSLWLILVLPAAEAYFVRRGAAVQIHDVRGWFLWALIGLGCLNYVGTRHGFASVIVAAGQVLLFSEHLPLLHHSIASWRPPCAYTFFLIAVVLAWSHGSRRPLSVDLIWTRFRDHFGVFWSFRIAERFNSEAESQTWPCRIGHFGVHSPNSIGPNETGKVIVPPAARKLLRSLLARFESEPLLESLDEMGA